MKKLFYPLLSVMLSCLSIQAHAQLTNNLQAYYPFGGNAQDQSGNGNNGQINGNVVLTQDRFGSADCAYQFDGDTGSYISIPASTSFAHPNGTFSISLWYKITTAGFANPAYLFGELNNTGGFFPYEYWLGIYDLDKATFEACWEADSLVTINTWNHLVGIYDNGTYLLYKNGVLVDSENYNPLNNSNNTIIIGAKFKGAIDDVRFYDRRITPNEIGQLYALQSSCASASIPEQQTLRVKLYPNPVRHELTIDCPTSVPEAMVSIYNVLGQRVIHQNIRGGSATRIDLSGKASGNYIVKVQTGAKVLATQIVQKL